MKKVLFATSALVAAGIAGSASAAEWETGVGGYYHAGFGFSDSNSQDGVGILRDGEIYFDAKLVADNGITFIGHVELESQTTDDQIDENWVRVQGSFGRLTIGGDDSAANAVAGVGILGAAGGHVGYADTFKNTKAAATGANGGGNAVLGKSNDSVGVHYSTPTFYGFSAHASYIPDADSDGSNDSNNFVYEDQQLWSAAALYEADFGDVHVGAAFGYTDIEDTHNEVWTFSGQLGYAGFTVAGFYEDDFGDSEWGVGGEYATGPWSVGGGYSESNVTEVNTIGGWISYAAAPGVTLTGGLVYDENNDTNNDDFGGQAVMSLSF